MMDNRKAALVAAVVFVVVVGTLVGGSALLGSLSGLVQPVEQTEPREYDTGEIVIDRIEADGHVDVQRQAAQTVVIDRAHSNGFDNSDIRELTGALTRAGHDVLIAETPGDLSEALVDADALVVIDPQVAYADEDAQAVQDFVADDGRLLLVGQPDRGAIVGFQLGTMSSEIDSIANRFGITFGADHLYDMTANDGNHRNVVTASTDHPLVDRVDTAVFYTSTHVSTADGEPLLVTDQSAQRSNGDVADEYAVAVIDGNVIAIGDADFMSGETYNVGDNNEFIAVIVEFLGGG